MKTLLTVLAFSLLFCSPSFAGKNAGGSLIVHTTGVEGYRAWTCDALYQDPGSCEDAGTQSDNPGDLAGIAIWLLAAFHETADPGVVSILFGLRHNIPSGWFYTSTFCGPEGTFESPEAGWPDDWAGSGNVIVFGSPIVGVHLFPYYYVVAWGFEGGHLGTGFHPAYGFAAFQDDGMPFVVDRTSNFGEMRWFEPGYNECPVSDPVPIPACCLANGDCAYLDEEDCLRYGGDPMGPETYCVPNLCAPAYIPEPTFQNTTWGRLKTTFN